MSDKHLVYLYKIGWPNKPYVDFNFTLWDIPAIRRFSFLHCLFGSRDSCSDAKLHKVSFYLAFPELLCGKWNVRCQPGFVLKEARELG